MIDLGGDSSKNRAASSKKERLSVQSRQRLTVLLVDARPWTREALARALETSCRVLRFGDTSELAQADVQAGDTVIVLNVTGIGLADSHLSDAIATARACLPHLPVVALSDSTDVDDIVAAIERGLRGYIPMSLELRLVVGALRFVAVGGTFVPAEPILANLDDAAPPPPPPEPLAGQASTAALVNNAAALNSVLETLTPREVAVLAWLRQGKSNKHIARELNMSEATVKVHVRHIMRKMGAVNRTQVAMFADALVKK